MAPQPTKITATMKGKRFFDTVSFFDLSDVIRKLCNTNKGMG